MKRQAILLSLVIAVSCGRNSSLNTTEHIIWTNVAKEIESIEGLVVSSGVVKLESDPLLPNINKCIFVENGNIVILSNTGVFKFSPEGKYLNKYGGIGRGPGEYMKIFDICTTLNGDKLLCLNHLNQVMVYDVKSGEYLRTIDTEAKKMGLPNATGLIPGTGDSFFLYIPNPSDIEDPETDFDCLIRFSSKGKAIDKMMKWKDFNIDFSFIPFVTQSGNNFFIRPQENENILYKVSDGEFSEQWQIDFGKKNIPGHFVYDNNNNPWMKLEELMSSNYYKHQFNHYLIGNTLFFSVFGPQGVPVNCLYDIELGKGVNWTSEVNISPIMIAGCDGEFFYFVFDKFGLDSETYTSSDPLLSYMVKGMNLSLSDHENPYLVKMKFSVR